MNNIRKELLQLAESMVDDLMNATDDEILSEAAKDGIDVKKKISNVRQILEKTRFQKARESLNKTTTIDDHQTSKVDIIDIDKARKRIQKARNENQYFLMAARFGEDIPDEDVMDLYRQMVKHGFIKNEFDHE